MHDLDFDFASGPLLAKLRELPPAPRLEAYMHPVILG
jgi:hypothetical protein